MNPNFEDLRTLRVAFDYWSAETGDVRERVICFTWIRNSYRRRFGATISRAQFERLWRLGFIEKAENSRGGNRRYYRLREPDSIACVLVQSANN